MINDAIGIFGLLVYGSCFAYIALFIAAGWGLARLIEPTPEERARHRRDRLRELGYDENPPPPSL